MSSLSVCISQNDSWSEIALLDGLSSGELSYLRRVTYQKNFSVGAHVLCVGQMCDNVYVVLHGALKVCSRPQSEPDKIVIHDLVGRGEVLGEMAALDGCNHSDDVFAIEPCELLCLPCAIFEKCLQTMPRMMLNVARILAQQVRRLNAQNELLATQNIDVRVIAQLLLYVERYGVTQPNGSILISIPLKQQIIASVVGASREKVNGVLAECQNKGCISLCSGNHILIRDQAALQQIYEEHKRKRRR